MAGEVSHVRGVPALVARYERLFEAYAARTRRHVAAMQELAALREEITRLRVAALGSLPDTPEADRADPTG